MFQLAFFQLEIFSQLGCVFVVFKTAARVFQSFALRNTGLNKTRLFRFLAIPILEFYMRPYTASAARLTVNARLGHDLMTAARAFSFCAQAQHCLCTPRCWRAPSSRYITAAAHRRRRACLVRVKRGLRHLHHRRREFDIFQNGV